MMKKHAGNRARDDVGTSKVPWFWMALMLLLCTGVGEWGCYGNIPGKYKPDGGKREVLANEKPAPQDVVFPDTNNTQDLVSDTGIEPPTTIEATPDNGTPDEIPKDTAIPEPNPKDEGTPEHTVTPEPQPEPVPERPTPPSRCQQVDPPKHTGKDLTLSSGNTLGALLAQAAPGDRIVVKAGTYPHESLNNVKFNKYVHIEAAKNAKVIFEGMSWQNCSYIAFKGIQIRKKALAFRDCHHIWIDRVDIDLGTLRASGLQIVGSGGSPKSHHYEVHNSRFSGGQRTIFIRTNFGPSNTWNHDLRFTYNDIGCGTNNCFQLSGARDMLIQQNKIKPALNGTGILLAGATRIQIRRNALRGSNTAKTAISLATPGKEWDNFKNVGFMITSDITVANNLIVGWANGILLGGTKRIDVVNNTSFGHRGVAFRLWRRTPKDYSGKVILTGNTEIRLWNNIFDKISYDNNEARPKLESNNLVSVSGGGGNALIKASPMFKSATDFGLKMGSPAINKGLTNQETPKVDQQNFSRDKQPDIGAYEAGSQPHQCP